MPIGNSFDLPEYNKEEEKLVKVGGKVQEWWDGLDYRTQIELMEIEYPDDSNLMTVDEMWEGLDWKAKVGIHISENEKDFMSEDELYDGGCMSNYDDNENERKEW